MEKRFAAEDGKLHEVIAFAEEEMETHNVDMKSRMAVDISLEELFVNIAHYAYPEGSGEVTVSIEIESNVIEITLTDQGIPFNPLEISDPDIHADLMDRDIGGLGIYMVKKYMDECHYERRDNNNIFTMRKGVSYD